MMVTWEDAVQQIKNAARQFAVEQVPLPEVRGRVLAQPVYADRDYPPFDRVAMDGIAIRFADWERGIRTFRIQQVILAGEAAEKRLEAEACYKIMTGAACPADADTVVRREDFDVAGDRVLVKEIVLKRGSHIAEKGEDLAQGDLVFAAPLLCDAIVVSVLAAMGMNRVTVFKRPSLAVLTTGSEVVEVDQQVTPLQIRNSNGYLLKNLSERWNPTISYSAHVPDNPEALRKHLATALQEDLVLVNGGVSAGDADFVPQVLGELGVEVLFHKVAIKPGKPLLVGKSPHGGIVLALPGNPLSCLTTFTVFAETYLYWCCGRLERPTQKGVLSERRTKKSVLAEFFPVYRDMSEGQLGFRQHNGSGDITAAVGACGIALHPATIVALEKGDVVTYFPL